MEASEFIDYYEILEISPNANSGTVERMFRYLAQRFSHFAAASWIELPVRPVFQISELTIDSPSGFFKRHSVPTEIILAMPVCWTKEFRL